MLDVFGSSGLRNTSDQAYGVVHSALVTDLDEDGLAQVDEREAHAEAASLEPLFAPRSVAVIGAGRAPGGVGHEVLRSILRGTSRARSTWSTRRPSRSLGCRRTPT